MLKGESQLVIAGVVKDFYIAPPTIPAKPVMLETTKEFNSNYDEGILFKYQEGSWPECKQRIEQLVKKMNPDIRNCSIVNMEEEYAKFLKSENALLLMLDFVTLVCVLISLFGVFSLVTLDCEQRRKEIAIRKVNGATTRHIMYKFFMKYMLLLLTATAVCIPGRLSDNETLGRELCDSDKFRLVDISGYIAFTGNPYLLVYKLAYMEGFQPESGRNN